MCVLGLTLDFFEKYDIIGLVDQLENEMPIVITYYKDFIGRKKQIKERYMTDEAGVKNGLYQLYHRNGVQAKECTYKNDVLHGTCTQRHENGRVSSVCTYRDGCLEGTYTSYYPDGMMRYQASFHDNQPVGEMKFFEKDGNIWMNQQKDGTTQTVAEYWEGGHHITRTENGQVVHEEELPQDRVKKVVRHFDKSKSAWCQTDYYYTGDHLVERVEWEPSFERSIHYQYRRDSDRLLALFSCLNGEKDGIYLHFDETGSVDTRLEYVKGKRDGLALWFYTQDSIPLQVQECGTYCNDKPEGVFISYDEQGCPTRKQMYQNGKPVVNAHMERLAFEKKAEAGLRLEMTQELVAKLRQNDRQGALKIAQQFHTQKADVPRRTALKFGGQRTRV